MPFKSEKQRRFLWAEHPEIAKRWAKEYPESNKGLPMRVNKAPTSDSKEKAAQFNVLGLISSYVNTRTNFNNTVVNSILDETVKHSEDQLIKVKIPHSDQPTYAGQEREHGEIHGEQPTMADAKGDNAHIEQKKPENAINSLLQKISVVLSQSMAQALENRKAEQEARNPQYQPKNQGIKQYSAPTPVVPPPMGAAQAPAPQAQPAQPQQQQGVGMNSPSANPIKSFGPLSASGNINGNAAFGQKNSPDSLKTALDKWAYDLGDRRESTNVEDRTQNLQDPGIWKYLGAKPSTDVLPRSFDEFGQAVDRQRETQWNAADWLYEAERRKDPETTPQARAAETYADKLYNQESAPRTAAQTGRSIVENTIPGAGKLLGKYAPRPIPNSAANNPIAQEVQPMVNKYAPTPAPTPAAKPSMPSMPKLQMPNIKLPNFMPKPATATPAPLAKVGAVAGGARAIARTAEENGLSPEAAMAVGLLGVGGLYGAYYGGKKLLTPVVRRMNLRTLPDDEVGHFSLPLQDGNKEYRFAERYREPGVLGSLFMNDDATNVSDALTAATKKRRGLSDRLENSSWTPQDLDYVGQSMVKQYPDRYRPVKTAAGNASLARIMGMDYSGLPDPEELDYEERMKTAASKPCSCGCGDTVATCKCGPDCKCRKPGGSCCKTEKTTTKESALGLWDRIRMKKERGGKPAKPGSKDYPDAKSWKKVTAISEKKSDSPAWQRSAGKNDEGGLNEKGRKSYENEHGGNLKPPVTESNPSGDRAKRQNSFCSRMCGMKSVNTGAATAKDPDSRINKSLRKWNCKCSSAVQFGGMVKLSLYRGLQNTPTDTGPEQMQDALFRFNQLRALARPSDSMLQGHNLSRKGFQHEMRRIATSSQDKDRFELSKIAPNPGLRAALAGAAGLAGTGALAYTNGLEGASVGLPLTALAAGGAYLHGQHQRSNLKNTAKLLKNYGLLNPQTLRQAYPLLGDDYSIS